MVDERRMRITTFDEFKELAQRGTFVPVCKEIVADLLTPVSAFLKIAEHSDYAFLLESVEGGEHVGRYSFLGKDPFLILRAGDGKTILDRAGQTTESDKPFITTLRELMASFHSPFVPGLPRFTGGAVGYLGYDAASWFEPVTLQASTDPAQDEAGFMLFDTVLAFDHVRHRILIIANARITGDEDLGSLYQFACAKIEFVERELARGLSHPERTDGGTLDVTSNVTRDEFERMVRTAKEYIAAGDIYQVVLSQRFEADTRPTPSPCIARCATSTRRPTCISSGWAAARSSARRRKCSCAWRAGASRPTRLRGRARAAGTMTRTCVSPRSSSETRRSGPNT